MTTVHHNPLCGCVGNLTNQMNSITQQCFSINSDMLHAWSRVSTLSSQFRSRIWTLFSSALALVFWRVVGVFAWRNYHDTSRCYAATDTYQLQSKKLSPGVPANVSAHCCATRSSVFFSISHPDVSRARLPLRWCSGALTKDALLWRLHGSHFGCQRQSTAAFVPLQGAWYFTFNTFSSKPRRMFHSPSVWMCPSLLEHPLATHQFVVQSRVRTLQCTFLRASDLPRLKHWLWSDCLATSLYIRCKVTLADRLQSYVHVQSGSIQQSFGCADFRNNVRLLNMVQWSCLDVAPKILDNACWLLQWFC